MLTTTLIAVALAPAASGLFASHVTVLPAVVQFQSLPPLAETRFSGAGTVSVTASGSPESLGPRLATARVYVSPFVPASKLPVWLLIMSTSADCVTGVTSVDVLLARCGSNVLLLTEPVLEIDVPTNDAESATVILRFASLCPAASALGCVHVRACASATQVQP